LSITFLCALHFVDCSKNCTPLYLRTVTVEAARADAEKIKLLGGAEAQAIESVGKAEAEMMRLKASAYKQYGDAAVLNLVLESLPKVRNMRGA
jgi:uncharacterized membrane protein YqiK